MKKITFIVLLLLFLYQTNYSLAQPLSNEDYAITQLETVVQENQNDIGSYMALCHLYSSTNKHAKMISLMEKTLAKFKKDPTIPKVFNNYAKKYYEEKNYPLAEKIAKITLSKFKDDPDTAMILGRTLLIEKKFSEAAGVIKNAITINPDALFLYDTLIDIYLIDKEYTNAFKYAQIAHEKNLTNISYYFLEALALQDQDISKSISFYKAYLEKLNFENDYEYRIKAAKKILMVLTESSNPESFKALINYLTKLKAPPSHIIVQARHAKSLFPNDSFFEECIQKTLHNL